MPHIPMDTVYLSLVLLVEAIALTYLAKKAWGWVLGVRLDDELTEADNPAAGVLMAGYLLGVLLALSGVLASPPQGPKPVLWQEALSFGGFGLAGVAFLFLALLGAPLIAGVRLRRDVVQGRNVAAATVVAASFVASGLIFQGSVSGEGAGWVAVLAVVVFQVLGQLWMALTALLFEWITPFKWRSEIVEHRNLAAAFGFAGAILGAGMLLRNAVGGGFTSWEHDLIGFALYGLPVFLLIPARPLLVAGVVLGRRNLNHEIGVDRNVAAGLLEGVSYLGFALLLLGVL